jgi:hypothetical protein
MIWFVPMVMAAVFPVKPLIAGFVSVLLVRVCVSAKVTPLVTVAAFPLILPTIVLLNVLVPPMV